MSKTISFVGDVMLERVVGTKYNKQPYNVVSDELVAKITDTDYVIGNLESPVVDKAESEGDHLQFVGNPAVLSSLKWINIFSLSNNHINDCGSLGMNETVSILDNYGFKHNGLFSDIYEPLIIDEQERIALVTVTDMMNIPFADDCPWKILRVGDNEVDEVLSECRSKGYFTILFAHIGILFSRYPNPVTYDYLHKCVDNGADMVVTVHSHCLGCMETYKDVHIFHSLGDFIMDGSSFRRRRSGILKVTIDNHKVSKWEIIPAEINVECQTTVPSKSVQDKMLKDFKEVTEKVEKHKDSYKRFFKNQYKIEMFHHSMSTISFLTKTRGINGMLSLLFKRLQDVKMVTGWLMKDRSNDQRDDDAIRADRKKFKQEELF
jgi:poly-gamma-glutamate synthesis protein (capsule biosynthesis protein)